MKYREFTDTLLDKVGAVNWGMVGRMSKIFKMEYILETADMFPDHMFNKHPTEKSRYLLTLCRKSATDEDYAVAQNQIDWSQF